MISMMTSIQLGIKIINQSNKKNFRISEGPRRRKIFEINFSLLNYVKLLR